MNLKTLILLAAAGYGIWFAAVGGRRIDEQTVLDHYNRYVAAFDANDGKAACKLFGDQVTGMFTSSAPSMKVSPVFSKEVACSAVDEFHQRKRQLEQTAGTELATNIEYSVQSIEISPDHRTATATVLIEMRIGTEKGSLFDRRSTQTDIIKRSFGTTRVVQSDGRVMFYK